MFPKLLLIILAAGATAAALLVNRQHRIDTAHEITGLHHRLTAQEQKLWRMETEIAQRLRPEEIRRALSQMGGEWIALPAPPTQPRSIDDDSPGQQLVHQSRAGQFDDEFDG